jgi:hypothetical protein
MISVKKSLEKIALTYASLVSEVYILFILLVVWILSIWFDLLPILIGVTIVNILNIIINLIKITRWIKKPF